MLQEMQVVPLERGAAEERLDDALALHPPIFFIADMMIAFIVVVAVVVFVLVASTTPKGEIIELTN